MIDQKQLENVGPFNTLNAELNPICHLLALLGGATIVVVSRLRVKYLDSILTNDGRCTCEIKSRIAVAKAAVNKKRALFY